MCSKRNLKFISQPYSAYSPFKDPWFNSEIVPGTIKGERNQTPKNNKKRKFLVINILHTRSSQTNRCFIHRFDIRILYSFNIFFYIGFYIRYKKGNFSNKIVTNPREPNKFSFFTREKSFFFPLQKQLY